jgi:hypothetical protein
MVMKLLTVSRGDTIYLAKVMKENHNVVVINKNNILKMAEKLDLTAAQLSGQYKEAAQEDNYLVVIME